MLEWRSETKMRMRMKTGMQSTYGRDVGRRDGEIRDLEALDAIDVELGVDDAALLAGLHRTGAELRVGE